MDDDRDLVDIPAKPITLTRDFLLTEIPTHPDWVQGDYQKYRRSYWTRLHDRIFELGTYYHFGAHDVRWELMSVGVYPAIDDLVGWRLEASAWDPPGSEKYERARHLFAWYFIEEML